MTTRKFFRFILMAIFLIFALYCDFSDNRDKTKESVTTKGQNVDTAQIQNRPGPGKEWRERPPASGRGQGQRRPGRSGRAWEDGAEVELSAAEAEAVQIKTARVVRQPLKSQLQAMGRVLAHPQRMAIVSYAFPARVDQVHVQIGDWVKSGQKLVTLQSEEVGTAKSEFYKARADFNLAEVNFERQKRLFDRGVGAQKDLLSRETELKVAQTTLNAAEKKLHVLGFTENQVEYISETHQINPVISLYATISGKVIENNAVLGAMVDQATEILILLDPRLLVIDADIYEKDIAKIKNGQAVEVSIPAYPDERFRGKVSYISDVLKENTRTITVRTEVDNSDFKLKPGMFADIWISLNHKNETLVLPTEAVLDDKEDQIVFVVLNGKYVPRVIKIGAKDESFTEILSGLHVGDLVVTSGNYQLKSKLYDTLLKKGHIH